MTGPAECATDLLAAIATIGEAVEVATGGWDRLDRQQVDDAYEALERARKRMAIIDAEFMKAHRTHHHVTDRGVGRTFAECANTSRAEGRRRAAAHHRLHQWESWPGSSGNPEYMPAVREKVEQGVIGADAVEKIDRAIRSMPAAIQAELTEKADPHIAELVEKVRVDDLDQLGTMLRALFGIDDPYTDEDRKRNRSIRVGKQGYDGMSKIYGHLTPHLAALFKRLAADHGRPGGLLDDAADDPRTPSQRLHDAVEAALAAGFGRGADPTGGEGWGSKTEGGEPEDGGGPDGGGRTGDGGGFEDDGVEGGGSDGGSSEEGGRPEDDSPSGRCGQVVDPNFGADSDTLYDIPDHGDEKKRKRKRGRLAPARGTTSIVAVTTLAELLALNGTASTDTNVQMTVADAVEHCDARNLFLQVLDFQGRTLYFGRSRRLGSMDQYLALFGEEGMSSAPMTSAPAASCHMHHIRGWKFGGTTDLPNFTFVDPGTHANTDDSRTDPDKWWSRPGNGPGEPRVVWKPPRSMDPERNPAENEHPAGWCNPGRVIRRENRRENRREQSREQTRENRRRERERTGERDREPDRERRQPVHDRRNSPNDAVQPPG
ncbi:DUF222 domain-containing protein [Corynebacterium freneyi]|uniref:DUF222 domain-containing protein n=1 Tax=Corynebacterium freneyi TaxID=134034 RepID=UPI00254BE573|nr:DUF222 domain-containing protein [Corynebacterium freneyi]MDK8768635.1 DUF222 domain-containing protein [Corynebacterium freneyi]